MTSRYVKSFSKGQITIPQDFRKKMGIGNNFWLKMSIKEGKLIAEPVEQVVDNKTFKQQLLGLKGNWFDLTDYKTMRTDVAARPSFAV